MLKCRAIQKITNKYDQTVGYILQDETGKTMSVPTENIKQAINNKQANVINLKISSNGRLMMVDVIPENFITIADIIAKESGVEYTEPIIKDKTALTQFKNTPYYLASDLLGNVIKICDNSGKNYAINSIDMTHKVASIIRANLIADGTVNKVVIKYSEYLIAKYGERVTPETDDSIRKYAELTGVSLTDSGISLKNKNMNLEIIYDCTDDWIRSFITGHSILSGINILTVDNCICNSITLKETSPDKGQHQFFKHDIKTVNISAHNFIRLQNCVCNNLIIDNLTLNFITIDQCYIENMLKSTGLKNVKFIDGYSYVNKIDIDNVIEANDLKVLSNQCRIKCNESYLNIYLYYNNSMAIKELYIDAKQSVMFGASNLASKHIKIKATDISLSVDNRLACVDDKIASAINITTNPYVLNKFNTDFKGMFKWQTYIELDENAKVKFGRVVFPGTCNRKMSMDELHKKIGDGVDAFVSSNIVSNISGDFTMYYGIVLQEGDHIEVDNLITPAGFGIKRNTGECVLNGNRGFMLMDEYEKASDISITINGDIIPVKKRSGEADRNAFIGNLVDLIGKNVKVRVPFNSVVYNRLKSFGVDVEITDASKNSEELNKLNRVAMKENMMGRSMLDAIINNLAYSESIGSGEEYTGISEFPVNTSYSVEIPREIEDYFGLVLDPHAGGEVETCDIQTYTFIELFKQLPASNLPFTKDALLALSSNSSIKMKAESHALFTDGISMHDIYIGYTNNKNFDKYIAITNGKKLICMGYAGNSEIEMSSKNITTLNHGALALVGTNEIAKLDKVDFANKEIRQSLTSNTGKLPQLLKEVEYFVTKYMNLLYNIDSKILLTLACNKGEENTVEKFRIQAFKANIKTSKSDIFSSLVHHDIGMDTINSIETIDSEAGLQEFKDTLNKQYKNSILYNVVLEQRDSNTVSESDNIFDIPAAEVSTLWQFAMTFPDFSENPYPQMSKQQIEMMFKLPNFNEVGIKEYDDIKEKFDCRQGFYGDEYGSLVRVTEPGIKLVEHRIDKKVVNRLKKYKTDYMECCIEIIEYIDENTGVTRLFVSDDTILSILGNCRTIQTRHNKFSGTGEQFFKFMLDEDLLFQPYKAEREYSNISSKFRSFCWSHKIDDWRDKSDPEKQRQIEDLSQDDKDTYYELLRHYKAEKSIEERANIFFTIGHSYEWIPNTGTRRRNENGIQTFITMDCKTGYMYMMAFTGKHHIPICRIQNYRKACEILSQIHKEDKKQEGVSVAIASANGNIFDLVELQASNIKDLREYRKKSLNNSFTSLMSYMPDEEILESFDVNEQSKSSGITDEISEMPNFNYKYLLYYMNKDIVKEIKKIPSGYIKKATYKAPGASNDILIDEYSNNSNYIYVIDKSLKVSSDFKLSELMDIN